ncbi:MAG: hypothetical protein ACRC33_29970 [Gemmataceae bacterium]
MSDQSSLSIRQGAVFTALSIGSCLIAYLLATALGRYARGPNVSSTASALPSYEIEGLLVRPAALRLGEVNETSDHKVVLPLKNVSGRTLHLADIQAGCACVDISPRAGVLEPNQTLAVNLTIDLTKRMPWERHAAEREVRLEIRPRLENGKVPEKGWLLEGKSRARVTADTNKLSFGDRPVSGWANEPRVIEARVHGRSGSLAAAVEPPGSGQASVTELGEGRFNVAIRPASSLPPGPFSFAVALSAGESGDGPKEVYLRVPVTGSMQPEVRAFPAQVLLGPRRVGTAAATVVQLQSPPGAGWEVDRIEIDDADLKAEAVAGGYRITQHVAREGDRTATVRFQVRKGKDGPVTPVVTAVSYYGQKAEGSP